MEQQSLLPDLTIDSIGAQQIRGIASWAKFLSIVGFVFCGIIVIVALFAGTLIASLSPYNQMGGSGVGAMITIVYIIFAAIYFIPTLFLFQSASKLKSAISYTDQVLLNEGLGKLKAVFQFWGIMTIIILSIYALVIIFALLGAMMAG